MEKLIEELEDIICHKSLNREELDTIIRTISCFMQLDRYLKLSIKECASKSSGLREIADHTHNPGDIAEAEKYYGMSLAYEAALRKLEQQTER